MNDKIIHLTARALEWLERSTSIHGSFVYHQEVARSACDSSRVSKPFCCGVEDVRALYLRQGVKSEYNPEAAYNNAKQFKAAGIVYTNCPTCRVLLDRAVERGPRKTGKYVSFREDGHPEWKKETA